MPSVALTLNELQDLAPYAYNDFTTVKNSLLPEHLKDIIPHKCKCGAETIITRDFTQLRCCNPACWVKQAHRLAYFCSYLGYKGIGEETGLNLFAGARKYMKYNSFMSAFLLDSNVIYTVLGASAGENFISIRDDLKRRPLLISDAVCSLGIDGVGNRSKLFDVVRDPITYISCLMQNKVDEVCSRAGIYAQQTIFSIKDSKLDMYLLVKEVAPNIVALPSSEIYIMITGKVSVGGVPYSRQEFVELCESLVDKNGAQAYKLTQTKAQSLVQYAIADAPSSSSKYKLGKELGILITADEFYNMLKERLGASDGK